jgi:carbon storage regulator CsrA
MLILGRKAGEQILIGKDIVVSVSRIEGSRVYLAIKAPDEVRVMRTELLNSDWRLKNIESDYARLRRKVEHGCTDASCSLCDKEQANG